jgi:hypothetical protein
MLITRECHMPPHKNDKSTITEWYKCFKRAQKKTNSSVLWLAAKFYFHSREKNLKSVSSYYILHKTFELYTFLKSLYSSFATEFPTCSFLHKTSHFSSLCASKCKKKINSMWWGETAFWVFSFHSNILCTFHVGKKKEILICVTCHVSGWKSSFPIGKTLASLNNSWVVECRT